MIPNSVLHVLTAVRLVSVAHVQIPTAGRKEVGVYFLVITCASFVNCMLTWSFLESSRLARCCSSVAVGHVNVCSTSHFFGFTAALSEV